ncbi:hypothetical protein [Flavobacterium gawalongense]|uniref:Uncharacterized protein n=1 Tax=Flavobacterium gawalongense TaxID=2594432 RepID=A0ABY3CQJ1_9FLAO|nr:hypothetical protein [Flavobacterium gawalongense]TRX03228.1 hypothetical protein FNW33_05200 [Flavobacterium gawalongense]TRX09890.1 hypothetical protein FNW12_01890 [Flavobacterium gawalongense]
MRQIILILIILFKITFSFGQEEKLNLDWVKLDSIAYNNILRVIRDPSLLKNKDKFVRSIIPFHIRETKDLGFGLTYIECAQYGGYVTASIKILSFENEIIQYEISYSDKDYKIIESIFKKNNVLKKKTSHGTDKCKPHTFCFQNHVLFDKFKGNVSKELGKINLNINTINSDSQYYYNYLINPINSYIFGTFCSDGDFELEGRKAINHFISKNDFTTIKEIIKGYNPEGRIYAVEALLNFVKEGKTTLTKEEKFAIQKIIALKIPIRICYGCIISQSTAKELLAFKIDFREKKRVIKKENNTHKEQKTPKKKD